jgi:ATP-binding cassette, subfamily B, bacterial
MAWGGGGGMFGGGGGMFGGGGLMGGGGHGGHVGRPVDGLPFAGIPSELQAGVETLLATEPDW